MQNKSVYKRINIQSGKNCGTCLFLSQSASQNNLCLNRESAKYENYVMCFDTCNKWKGRNNVKS